MPTRRAALAAPLLLIPSARAQAPALRILVPDQAGEDVERMIRLLAPRMQARLGQAVAVEGGAAATPAALRPDGTVLLASGTWLVLDPLLDRAQAWAAAPLQPVARLALLPLVYVANMGAPWRTLADAVVAARSTPGLATGAVGTAAGLALRLLRLRAGLDPAVTAFPAAPPAMAALLSGDLGLALLPLSAALGTIRAGQLRALAVASDLRTALLPEVPTASEAGYGEAVAVGWCGLHAPAGLPAEALHPLLAGARAAGGNTEARQAAARLGAETAFLDSTAFAAFIAQDRARWERILAALAGPR